MKRILAIVGVLAATAASAEPDYIEEITLKDGRVLSTGMGDWGTALTVDGEALLEDAQIGLIDFGRAGVLVEMASGGNSCPWSYSLIDKATGQFREVAPNSDRSEVFAECEMLLDVVPEANLMLTYRYDTRSHAIGYSWNGYALDEIAIPISRENSPEPNGGDMVTRWNDVDPYEMLSDPVEQKRLLQVLSEDQFDRLSWLMSFRSPAILQSGFLVADGCVKYLCDAENAIVAIRVSDGQPFVRIFDNGDVTLAVPEGEDLPRALIEHAVRYPAQ